MVLTLPADGLVGGEAWRVFACVPKILLVIARVPGELRLVKDRIYVLDAFEEALVFLGDPDELLFAKISVQRLRPFSHLTIFFKKII